MDLFGVGKTLRCLRPNAFVVVVARTADGIVFGFVFIFLEE